MIFKVIGAILVTVGCSGLGIWMAGQWKLRLKVMENLRKMIFLLKGEIVYANSPLTEAFERTGKKSDTYLGELFLRVAERMERQQGEPFYEMWKEEIDGLSKGFPLTKEDRQDLKGMGEHLGYLDREMQERTLLLYLEQLDLTIEYLREHQRERSRLYTSLGIMGGLFLTIVMC